MLFHSVLILLSSFCFNVFADDDPIKPPPGGSARYSEVCWFHLCSAWLPEWGTLMNGKQPGAQNEAAANLLKLIDSNECEVTRDENNKVQVFKWHYIGAPIKAGGKSYYPCEGGSVGFRASSLWCHAPCKSLNDGNPRFVNTQAGPSTGIEQWPIPKWAFPPWPQS